MATVTDEEHCYRHPDRETGVRCSNCGRPICPDCMTPTPVGMRCPECSKDRTKVRRVNTGPPQAGTVTIGLIIVNVVLFLATGQFGVTDTAATSLFTDLGLFGPSVHVDHEYWRLVTSGFMHSGLLHIGFNMYLLYILGQTLEQELGPRRFLGVYMAALLAGSFGALAAEPLALTVGASGAIFGLMGFTFFELRARGIDPFSTGIGTLILLNLGISFLPGLNISVGGHIGGLIGGSLMALGLNAARSRRLPAWSAWVVIGAVAVVSVIGALAVAGDTSGIGV